MARLAIYSHQTLITGSNNPAFQISKTAWNQDPGPSGMMGFSPSTKTIASHAIIPTDTITLVLPSSGTTDTLNFMDYTQTNDKDLVMLLNSNGANTITVANNVGSPPANQIPIVMLGGVNKVLSTTTPLVLIRLGTTQWQEIIPFNVPILSANNVFTLQNTFTDTQLFIANNVDSSKKVQFSASGITAGQTRIMTIPDGNTTLAGLAIAQTFSAAQTFASSGLKLQNPAQTFTYTFVGAAILANSNITMPLLSGNDTMAVLGTAQTWTAVQTYNSNIVMNGANISLGSNSLTTSNNTFKELSTGLSSQSISFQNNNAANGTLFSIIATASLPRAGLVVWRTSDVNTNTQLLYVGSDLATTGHFEISSRTGGTIAAVPIDVLIQGANGGTLTKLMSFDTANTITSYATFNVTLAGMVVGSATGGDKGVGTINVATGIYLNGLAYTNPDYVFEKYFTGKIIQFIDNQGAREYEGLKTIDDLEKYIRENYRFPHMNDNKMDLFRKVDKMLLISEELALYLFDHERRLLQLERLNK